VVRTNIGSDAYMLLFEHLLGPQNVGNMASAYETKSTGTLYNGEKKIFTWYSNQYGAALYPEWLEIIYI
jgi:hypothetical protein